MDRIDLLLDDSRLTAVTGAVIARDLDDELQALVREASDALNAPIALVSLVLKRLQFFRAHVGLPPDLEITRSTDRCVSFCQFVVRDRATFKVSDALVDERIPQDLPRRYGIRAYLGVPVRIGDVVIGSFCVIDTATRSFSSADEALLQHLATRVSARLEQLTHDRIDAPDDLRARAAQVSLAEIRNTMTALAPNVSYARTAALELGPALHLAREATRNGAATFPAAGALRDSARALTDLDEALADLERATERLLADFGAFEQLFRAKTTLTSVAEAVVGGARLATHATKLVGGTRLPDAYPAALIASTEPVAVCAVSTFLVEVASALHETNARGGIDVLVGLFDREVEIHARCPLPADARRAVGQRLFSLFGADVAVRDHDDALRLVFARGQ